MERLCSANPSSAEVAAAAERIIAVLHIHGALTCAALEERANLGGVVRRAAVAKLLKAGRVKAAKGNKLRQPSHRTATFVFLPGCAPAPKEYPERVGLAGQRISW